ncbi:MAP kinase-activated protein kinase 5-like [Hydractinia symbiolongicarpus]|uniref:MAP kinase-activated protein kinase 5-like n=1 Tax=Hydractinia symbiolongicarpus TaxID=13093 RepID=UPI00254C3E43|nr:MAP kinase-activated protein kinase 5-like [Hydractinia symbiolongicarpus]
MYQQDLVIKSNPIEEEYTISWNKKLGSGISGPVRICKKRATGEEFALKCLLDKPKSRQEVELHWRCSGHPHIVSCVDVFQNEIVLPGEQHSKKCLLVILDMMKGGELFDRIRKKISFTEKEASEITRQVAAALFHIHSLNIAHRDLKPENLLIMDKSDNVIVKLTDFGFAKIDKGNLMTPQFTPYYVSPQVLEAQKFHRAQKMGSVPSGSTPYTYDKSCDIWSLGVIIYIMLCGYPPFYSENPRKQLSQGMKRRIMHGEYDFPAPEWSKVSDLAKDVVKKMLVICPSERMSVQELVQHPWLNSGIAPETVLQSPHHMLDQDAFDLAVNTHSKILADMRLPDTSFLLDVQAIEKNPIVLKRKKAQQESEKKSEPPLEEVGATHRSSSAVETPGIKALRDMIAFLYMPPIDKKDSPTFEDFLRMLTLEALKHNGDSRRVNDALASEHWNGREYTRAVNKTHLAKNLSDIVMHYQNHQYHQR